MTLKPKLDFDTKLYRIEDNKIQEYFVISITFIKSINDNNIIEKYQCKHSSLHKHIDVNYVDINSSWFLSKDDLIKNLLS